MHILPRGRGRLPLLATIAVLATAAPAPAARAQPPAAAVLRLLNAARATNGAPPLRADVRLARAARTHSRDMVAHRYFAHESYAGERPSDRIARTGWMRGRRHWRVGENLAWGRAGYGRPAAVVAAWLASPVHRRVLLRPSYRAVGIGIVHGTPVAGSMGGRTYTADFGS